MKEAQRAVSTLLPKEVGMTEDGTAEITALLTPLRKRVYASPISQFRRFLQRSS